MLSAVQCSGDEKSDSATKTKFKTLSILQGDPEAAQNVGKKELRVFISSTFTDTKAERNHLMKHVWPDISNFCQQHGLEFRFTLFHI